MGWKAGIIVTLVFVISLVNAKPANTDPLKPSQADQAEPRRVVTTWSDNGWQGSARLPSSTQSGGNDHSSTKDLTGRTNRRLHKWDKTEEISDETEPDNDHENRDTLAQSLNSMASNLNDKGVDESLENSSEKDVFLGENGSSTDQNETDEISDEEASPTNDPKTEQLTTWTDQEEEEAKKFAEKQKADGPPTTPKGLTTWSAVNGGSGSYIKGSVQKVPSDYTVSSGLVFGTDKPTVATDLVTKERASSTLMFNPTTEMPRTTKGNPQVQTTTEINGVKKRKPYHKNKKVVLPNKFVKPPLEEVTAEAVGTDATHTIFKTKIQDPQSKIAGQNYAYSTKRPQWPYQMPVRKIATTKRPMAFSRITAKPKNPYVAKKPQTTSLSLTTPTTTAPSTSTVYTRNPTQFVYPFPSISFTNLGFMDFLRSQIIPRIGLSLISFMAASPLILSMIGASAVGRRKRSLDRLDTDKVKYEYISSNVKDLPKFDFSTIKKKLHKMEMIHTKKRPRAGVVSQVVDMIQKFMNTKGFAKLKSKLFEAREKSSEKMKRNGFKHS